MKIAFVRYGEHSNGHLNEYGKKMMALASEHLMPLVQNQKVCIVCAKIPRAIESAKIIAKSFNTRSIRSFLELYAAEEEGVAVNLEAAGEIIYSVGKKNDIIVVIASREYIETLPNYLLNVSETKKTTLDRGEVLVLDYDKRNIVYFKPGM